MGDYNRIAKTWYTEQRGRVNGNTKSWEELTEDEQANIVEDVISLTQYMREVWQYEEIRQEASRSDAKASAKAPPCSDSCF